MAREATTAEQYDEEVQQDIDRLEELDELLGEVDGDFAEELDNQLSDVYDLANSEEHRPRAWGHDMGLIEKVAAAGAALEELMSAFGALQEELKIVRKYAEQWRDQFTGPNNPDWPIIEEQESND